MVHETETLDPTYVMPIDDGNQNYDVTGGTGDNTEGERTKQAKSPFDQLVIPDEHKLAILSLVSQHFRDKNRERQTDNAIRDNWVDIVRGKGTYTHSHSMDQRFRVEIQSLTHLIKIPN